MTAATVQVLLLDLHGELWPHFTTGKLASHNVESGNNGQDCAYYDRIFTVPFSVKTSTDCVYHSVLTSRWLSWRSACSTVSRHLNQLVRVTDLPGRRRLRSSSSLQLLVPPFRLTTVGRRTFPIAASLLWNSLPPDV